MFLSFRNGEKATHSIDDAFLKEVIDDIVQDSQIGKEK